MPTNALAIEFKVQGLSGALSAFAQLSAASKGISRFAAQSGGGRGTQGPRQRLPRLLNELAQAQGRGDRAAAGDVGDAIRRAERQIRAGQPKSLGTKLAGLVRSTRVGADGVMPLIGQLLDVLGPEGSLVVGVGGAALSAAEAIGRMTAAAAAAGAQFGALRMSTGGTGPETALASQIGGALGVSPEQVGGLSAALQQAIGGGDAIAQGAAAQAGVSNAGPRGYTAADEGKNLLKIADYLRGIKSDGEAIQYARKLGPAGEALLPYRSLSQYQVDLIHQTAATQNDIFTPGMQKQSADFNSSSAMLKQAMDNLAAASTGPAARGLTYIADTLTGLFDGLAERNKSSKALQVAASTIAFGPSGLIASLFGLRGGTGGNGGMSELEKNTEALKKNSRAVQDAIPGRYGHGERVGKAEPSAFGQGDGFALRKQLAQQGAFLMGPLV